MSVTGSWCTSVVSFKSTSPSTQFTTRASPSCVTLRAKHHHHHHQLSHSTLYQVLGIHMGATCQEVKAAYRRLAREMHPDVSSSSLANEFVKVNEAYETLSDPNKRAQYDKSLAFIQIMTMTTTTYSNTTTTRRWETDQCW